MNDKLKKKDYQQLIRENKKVYTKNYVFYYKEFDRKIVKTAIKKKVGKAVTRNYYKRRLKEILRELSKQSLNKKIFILGIVLRKSPLTFHEEKEFLEKRLGVIFQ